MRVAGCFLYYEDKFLLLHRHTHKPDGNTWGLPGGKTETGESDLMAITRELYEETGYQARPEEFKPLGVHEFDSPTVSSLQYVAYELQLAAPHDVVLETAAHSEYRWVTVEQADEMDDLIYGLHDLFRIVHYI